MTDLLNEYLDATLPEERSQAAYEAFCRGSAPTSTQPEAPTQTAQAPLDDDGDVLPPKSGRSQDALYGSSGMHGGPNYQVSQGYI